MICIGCEVEARKVEKNRALEKLITLSVEKIVNKANRHQIAAMAETYYIDSLQVDIGEESFHTQIPLKLKGELLQLGKRLSD